jgi:hypothetical protein
MAKVHVSVGALRRRRDQLSSAADSVDANATQGDVATVCLLLFYAAECGLKAQLLLRQGHRNTTALEEDVQHDLRRLAKQLRLPRIVGARLDRLQSCKLSSSAGDTIALAELHQAWRYGAKLDPADEKEARETLRALISWCRQDKG